MTRRSSSKNTAFRTMFACVMLTAASAAIVNAQTVIDGFEEATISSFWTSDGSATLTNSVMHSGSQSLSLTGPVNFMHDYGSPRVGSVSVWVLGEQLCCGEAAGLQLSSSDGSSWALVQQSGNDNCNSCFQARFGSGGTSSSYSFSGSASDWHLFEIRVDSTGASLRFDGQTVATTPSVTTFQIIDLTVWGGYGSAVGYFDDFVATVSGGFTTVDIDIKPGSFPNSINIGASGVIPVAILSTPTFSAPIQVDANTLSLAGASVRVIGRSSRLQCSAEDVNGDGLADLVCHFNNDLSAVTGDSIAALEGATYTGVSIRGEDSIKIVP